MNLDLIPGTLPPGVCYADEQSRYNDYFSHGLVNAPDLKGILVQDATPAPAFQSGYGWIKTVGGIPNRRGLYIFFNGAWMAGHPLDPGAVGMYEGDITLLWQKDGGSNTPVTVTTGPFWEEITAMQGRSPMHPGTIPGSTGPKTLADAEAYGEAVHLLTFDEMLNHAHGTGASINAPVPDAPNWIARAWTKAATLVYEQDWTESPANFTSTIGSGDRGTTEAIIGDNPSVGHQTVHPVYGIYFIRRTARLWYV